MALSLYWEIEGEKQLVRRLRGIQAEMGDWAPAFQRTAQELKSIFSNDVFQTQGRAIGVSWPPLKPSTLREKARLGYGGRGPLERTGRMRNAFRSMFKPDMAAVWNAVAYFQYLQSNRPRRKLPRRIMMKLGHQQREIVVKIFHTHFVSKIKNA
jgi:hypothetical protein